MARLPFRRLKFYLVTQSAILSVTIVANQIIPGLVYPCSRLLSDQFYLSNACWDMLQIFVTLSWKKQVCDIQFRIYFV